MFCQEIRRAYVSAQHALFDNFMGIVAVDGHDTLDFALFIELNAGFNGFKINGSALFQSAPQHFVHALQVVELRQEVLELFAQWMRFVAVVLQDLPHFGLLQTRLVMTPRSSRARRNTSYMSYKWCSCGTTCLNSLRSGCDLSASCCRISHTLVYVRRAWE